jgi:chaperonin GroEL
MKNTEIVLEEVSKKFSLKEKNLGYKDKLLEGVHFLAEAVKVTLGAKGKNVMFIDPKQGKPKVTKDGVTVTRNVFSHDPIEQMAINIVKESAEQTVKTSGDGTTTTIVLAEYLILHGMKLMQDSNISYYELAREMDKAKKDAVAMFKEMSVDIKTSDNVDKLLHVATVSSTSEEIGKFIYDIIKDIGIFGAIEVKSSNRVVDKIDKVKGIKVHKGFYAPQFVNDLIKMQWKVEGGVYIVLLDDTIRSLKDIKPYINAINGKRNEEGDFITAANGEVLLTENNPILFMVNEVEPTVLQTIINNKVMNPEFNIMIVEHDGFGDRRIEIMNDIAALTGAIPGSRDGLGEIGFCQEVIVDEDTTSILGGDSDENVVLDLIQITERRLEDPDLEEHDRQYLKRRLATLQGGVAVVHVGAPTEVEMYERKDRIDDAVEAVRAAIDRGISVGGGYTQLKVSNKLMSEKNNTPGYLLVGAALSAPFAQLCKNADVNAEEVSSGILSDNLGYDVISNTHVDLENYKIYDPTGVLIDSLSNAISVAKSILSTEVTLYRD